MTVNLTFREESLLWESIQTRIRTVEKLIQNQEDYPCEATPTLIYYYSEDLKILKELEKKFYIG